MTDNPHAELQKLQREGNYQNASPLLFNFSHWMWLDIESNVHGTLKSTDLQADRNMNVLNKVKWRLTASKGYVNNTATMPPPAPASPFTTASDMFPLKFQQIFKTS